MNRTLFNSIILLTCISGCFITISCTPTTKSYSSKDVIHYDEHYDASDQRVIVGELVNSLLSKVTSLKKETDKPEITVYGIINRTSEHIDTSAIANDICKELYKSGKVTLIDNTERKNIEAETAYQYSGAVSPETRIKKGQQIGPKYNLTGSLHSIEKEEPRHIRLKKKSLMTYNLHLKLTSFTTGESVWLDNVEVVRESSKPIIGW